MLNEKGILQDDTYRLFVPIQEHDLLKSVEVDENGDYILQGVMTSEDKDEEDDSITPEGMDCSYFLDKGWIKYEHGNSPNQFIGEPLEVKVGQFEHPTLHKSVKGIYVKGRLFAQRELARQAVNTIQDLQKSNTKRRMGWSIEGNVKERDRKTGKIIKSVLRNVVLTMNPVNTTTWAELAKSFAKNHELTINMEKSMDVAAAAPVMPQSIEGYDPEKDEQEKWVKMFREFVRSNLVKKSLRTKFISSSPSTVGMTAYNFALDHGLDNGDAYEFASYIAEKQNILKSLFRINSHGGETMSKLASMLDTDLEELKKSLEEEDEELEKSVQEDKKKKKASEEEGEEEEGNEGGEEEGEEEEDNEGGEEEGEEEEEEEKKEKSLKTHFAKSLAEDKSNAEAFEVSDFLANLVDEVGFHMDGFSKSMTHVTKQQNAVVKSLAAMGDLIKGLTEKLESMEAENADFKKSLDTVLEAPVGRRSAVSTRELETIKKSLGAGAAGKKVLNRNDISDILVKSFEAGELEGSAVARFEAGVSLDKLNLPDTVKEKLGMRG